MRASHNPLSCEVPDRDESLEDSVDAGDFSALLEDVMK